MVIKLNSDNRPCAKNLFDPYPYVRGCMAAVIENGMGKVFADSEDEPSVALAVLWFNFLAGDALHEDAPLLLDLMKPGKQIIAPTPAWEQLLVATYPGKLTAYSREAFQLKYPGIDKLRRFRKSLAGEYEFRQVKLAEVTKFETLAPFAENFISHEDFVTRGVGFGVLHDGMYVSGAASGAIGGGKVDIMVQTHRQFRRQGLARAVSAALMLYCLEHALEPCWDAANEPSSALARQLGFRSTGKYNVYRIEQIKQ